MTRGRTYRQWFAVIVVSAAMFFGCHRGEKGTLTVENETGRDLYCSWTILPKDSVRIMDGSPPADSLRTTMLRDGEQRGYDLPAGYTSTDRVTIRMYSLDTTTTPKRYRLESLTTLSVGLLEAQSWRPVEIQDLGGNMRTR